MDMDDVPSGSGLLPQRSGWGRNLGRVLVGGVMLLGYSHPRFAASAIAAARESTPNWSGLQLLR
jgi:hypothetical protein